MSMYVSTFLCKTKYFFKGILSEDLSYLLIPRALGMQYWVTTTYRLRLSSSDVNDCLILDEILSNPLPLSKQEAMDDVYRAVLCVLQNISLPVPANVKILVSTIAAIHLTIIHC